MNNDNNIDNDKKLFSNEIDETSGLNEEKIYVNTPGEDDVRNHIVGVCNWERPTITYEQYEKLQEDMALARIKATTIYLFSAKSFDPRLVKLASEDESVILVDMKEL
jgi:hypothetical protein